MPVKKTQERLFFLLLAAIALVILLITAKDLFFFDEDIFVTAQHSSFMLQGWQRSFLVKQFFKAENFFFGTSPSGYHIVTVVLHLANALTGVFLFDKILRFSGTDGTIMPAKERGLFFFFIIFLLSPVHSEPMGYILAQGIMICTLFAQLCLICFITGLEGKKFYSVAGLLFFGASLLCYEISWLVPVMTAGIVLLGNVNSKRIRKKGLKITLLYWVAFFLWMVIKAVFISATLVADYGNISLADILTFKTCRNAFLLFIRSFLPPAQNSTVLIAAVVVFAVLLFSALNQIRNASKKMLWTALLLVILVLLAALPAALFGIDTHDTESERYVYFSSVFAVMLIVYLSAALMRNVKVLQFVMAVYTAGCAFILFSNLQHYKRGGNFSRDYLNSLQHHTQNAAVVYTINQPSQFKGALLLRAFTRLPQKSNEHITVLQEYMEYLYKNTSTTFITLSANEPQRLSDSIIVLNRPAANAVDQFPEAGRILQATVAQGKSVVIAALSKDTLIFFR